MQTDLEKKSIEARKNIIVKNTFKEGVSEYGESSDLVKSPKGKGTDSPSPGHGKGDRFDTQNGGSEMDINGNPNIPYSGRKGNMVINKYGPQYGYNEEYVVDTSGNEGQIILNEV